MLERGMIRRRFIAGAGAAVLAGPVLAAPRPYRLDRDTSTVAFGYRMNGQPFTGRMPVASADILLDVDSPSASRVSAELDAARADAGPFYATTAMKSESVLDVARYPRIIFRSQQIAGTARGATITGALTIRGVTRQIALDAILYRQRGAEPGDRSRMSILMTGSVDRRDFGAGGYLSIVEPTIRLQILTRIVLT